jgi:hypothetical protein
MSRALHSCIQISSTHNRLGNRVKTEPSDLASDDLETKSVKLLPDVSFVSSINMKMEPGKESFLRSWAFTRRQTRRQG